MINKIKQVEEFFASYPRHLYKKNDVIIRAEDPPAGVTYLEKGFVRMSIISEKGDTLVLHVFKPGSFFPMMWVINDTPNRYFYEAMTPVHVYRAPRIEVSEFLKKNPDILFDLTGRLLSGMSGMLQRMEHLVLDDAHAKVIHLLLYFVQNFGTQAASGTVISLPHREVGAWIGTTRETASLQMEMLVKKNLLIYEKRQIIIPDVKLLAAQLETKA